MDYRSFASGRSNNILSSKSPLMIEPPQKKFGGRFIVFIITLLLIAGSGYAIIGWWGNQEAYPDTSVTYTPQATSTLNQQGGKGILTGHVTVGPLCGGPVGGTACPPKPQAYTSRRVLVYKADGNTFVTSTALVPEAMSGHSMYGTYRFELAPGTYVIKATGSMPPDSQMTKGTVTIKSGQTTTLNFDIDTGIR